MKAKTGIAINEVIKERDRQEFLKAEGRFQFTCADLEMTTDECMMVLMEEVGEMCRAILEYKMLTVDQMGEKRDVGKVKIKTECIQVAAVALAMVERFAENE